MSRRRFLEVGTAAGLGLAGLPARLRAEEKKADPFGGFTLGVQSYTFRQFKLEQIYLQHAALGKLPKDRYEVFHRNTGVHVELYREENVPLETEEARLSQRYQKLAGSLTVRFHGEEKTLAQMARYLEEPDRALRQEAEQALGERFDLRGFHDVVLGSGAVPLSVLEEQVRDYIEAAKKR